MIAPPASAAQSPPLRSGADRWLVPGSAPALRSVRGALEFAAHHLSPQASARKVTLEYTESSQPRGERPTLPGTHRNWLRQTEYQLPLSRFGAPGTDGTVDLIDAFQTALRRIAHDGIRVVKPIGSVAYARDSQQAIAWDVVRDIDLWCYVSPATIASAPFPDLSQDLNDSIYDELESRGVRCRMTTKGNTFVLPIERRPVMVGAKLADLSWLSEGIHRVMDRDMLVRPPSQPAYAHNVRREWAAYTYYENYYPSEEAADPFAAEVARIDLEGRALAGEAAYRDNLAVGLSQFERRKVAHATFHRYRFLRHSFKALKVMLVLSVITRDARLQDTIVREMMRLRSGEIPATGPTHRLSYLYGLMGNLEMMRSVERDTFERAAMIG